MFSSQNLYLLKTTDQKSHVKKTSVDCFARFRSIYQINKKCIVRQGLRLKKRFFKASDTMRNTEHVWLIEYIYFENIMQSNVNLLKSPLKLFHLITIPPLCHDTKYLHY